MKHHMRAKTILKNWTPILSYDYICPLCKHLRLYYDKPTPGEITYFCMRHGKEIKKAYDKCKEFDEIE